MPRLAKRVTSFFPGKGPTESSSASSASSASAASSASSASATSAAAAAAKTNNQVPPRNSIDSTDIDGSSSHLRVNDDDDDDDTPSVGEELTSAPYLSSLLTATSERNLPPDGGGGGGGGGDGRMILQSAVRMTSQRHTQQGPKKSILKSTTSSISTIMSDSVASGGDAYFTTSSSSSSISSSRRDPNNTTKLLSFTSIHVREYPVLIGDNPSVGQGVPLTIGWEPQTEESYQVEDFESNHRAEPVLSLKEMKFTEEERAQIAKNLGYSDGKINKIAHHVKFSTLTRKKKIIRTLHLDVMKTSFRSGLTKVSNSSRKLLGTKHDDDDNNEGMGDDDNGDDRDEMAF